MCEINISKYYFGIIDMKTIKSKEMDMLNGGLVGKLILFSLPLAFSSILQQLFNSADVAVVGRFAGDNALAAVGSCVALVGIFVNLIVGLAVGPNAVLANLIGQKQRDKINDMVHTILTFGTILGLGLMILGFASARIILELSGTPSGVLAEALLYIRIYFLSIPFMTVYNFGAAILRSGYDHEYEDYICTDKFGRLITPNYVTDHFANVIKKYKLKKIRFHDLRYSCASLLLANGVPMKAIQEWLGRSTFHVTISVPRSMYLCPKKLTV